MLKTAVSLLLTLFVASQTAAVPSQSFDTAAYAKSSIIRRDVAIIGGGSSGTYAAINLRDKGKSVVVIDKQSVLGGHTNTYTDPATGTKIDYGVVVFDNTSTVTSYFSRFNIPLVAGTGSSGAPVGNYYVDFRTGKNVTGYIPPDPRAAFGAYAAQLAKYPFLNTPGWNLPDPVPSDLLIPFGDFVKKYQLDAAVPTINQYAQGFGDLLSIPSLYVLKYFGESVLQGAQTAFLTTARHDNSELYEKARAELGGDALLDSTVLATFRSKNGVKIAVKTPQGLRLILAKKLLISIPPKLSNLRPFDLSSSERTLFGQFLNGAYYTGLLRNTGIPDTISVTNTGADTPYNLPPVPAVYGFSPTAIPGITDVKFGASAALPNDAAVKAAIVDEITRLRTAGTIPTAATSTPEFVAYNSHTPYELRVPAEAVEGGFYTRLNGLQGVRSTWWTGAAFNKHDSGDMWAFTGTLLGTLAA